MRAQIVGYESLPDGLKHGLDAIIAPFGASIIVSDAEIATAGLVLATRADMFSYNDTLEPKNNHSLVGRCWETPLGTWLRYRDALANPESVPDYSVRRVLKEPESVQGFANLFVDGGHMNVSVLRICLNDGMTDRISKMGPKSNEFLTGFADYKL